MSREKQIEEFAGVIGQAIDHHSFLGDERMETIDMVGIAKTLYNAGYRKQEWISVEDRLPEESCECLIATIIGGIYQVSYSSRYKAFNALDTDEAKYAFKTVTHWMPLPEAPKMKGGAE